MKEIKVIPLKSVGEISFGMERSKVREILGEFREFKKSKFSSNTTDDFNICHVYYDKENKCNAIELFGDIDVQLEGKKVFPGNFNKICDTLKTVDSNIEIEEDSCTSIKYSIGAYAPDGVVETILFGCNGYYK